MKKRLMLMFLLIGLLCVSCTFVPGNYYITLEGYDTEIVKIEVYPNSTFIVPFKDRTGYELVSIDGSDGVAYRPGSEIKVTQDLTLSYEWKEIEETFDVVFFSQGEPTVTMKVVKGTTLVIPERSREGFELISIADMDGNTYKQGQKVTVSKDITFVYSWNAEPSFHTVTIKGAGTEDEVFKVLDGEVFRIPEKTKHGFELVAVNKGAYAIGQKIEITSDLVLTYEWRQVLSSYSVTIVSDGEKTQIIEYFEGDEFTVPAKERTGFALMGIRDAKGESHSAGEKIIIKNDLTIIYSWDQIVPNCTVTLTGLDGKDETIEVVQGSEFVIPFKEKEGYRIKAVSIQNEKHVSGETICVDSDIVLSYEWQKVCNVYILTDGEVIDSRSVDVGSIFKLDSIVRSGYELVNVSTVDGTIHAKTESITVKDDVTLNYSWIKLHEIKLTNNGIVLQTVTVKDGEPFKVPELTQEGYRTNGLKIIGGGTCNIGDTLTVTRDMVLCYQWIRVFNVRTVSNGQVVDKLYDQDSVFTVPDFRRDGFKVTSIKDSDGKTYGIFDEVIVTKDMVFTWEWIEYIDDLPASDFEYTETDKEVTITKYIGKSANVGVPARINDKPVTAIGDYAFYDCAHVKAVRLPYGVRSIGNDSFASCKILDTVILPESLQTIGNSTFWYSEALETIDIPDSVSVIGDGSFQGCSKLKKIVIPEKVKVLESWMFSQCVALTSVTLPSELTEIQSGAFSHCEKLVSISIPTTVSSIGMSAFEFTGLTSCIFPEGIKTLSKNVLAGSHITAFDIPDSVTSIEEGALGGCWSLASVSIGPKVETIGNLAFYANPVIASVVLPDSVITIGDEVFKDCKKLSSIKLGNNLQKMGKKVFMGCTDLHSLTLPKTLTEFGSVSVNCGPLNTLTVEKGNPVFHSVNNCIIETAAKKLKCAGANAVIPSDGSVEIIPDYGFSNTYGIKSLEIPSTVKTIGRSAFASCYNLESVTIKAGVDLPGGAFADCKVLKSVDWQGSPTAILGRTFEGCHNLENFTIPESVTSIGEYAFSGCSKLTSLDLPAGLESIGSYCFSQCSGIKTFRIPKSVNMVDYAAFYFLDKDTILLFEPGVSTSGWDYDWAYKYKGRIAKNYVDGALFGWEMESDILSIGPYLGNEEIVTIPDTINGIPVRKIHAQAFMDNTKLKKVIIPASVTVLGKEAFSNCSNLSEFQQGNINYVDSQAFAYCKSIPSIRFEKKLNYLGSWAFIGWTYDQSVYIDDTLAYNFMAPDWDYGCHANITLESNLNPYPGY